MSMELLPPLRAYFTQDLQERIGKWSEEHAGRILNLFVDKDVERQIQAVTTALAEAPGSTASKAAKAGLSRRALENFINGNSMIAVDRFLRLRIAFQWDIDQLCPPKKRYLAGYLGILPEIRKTLNQQDTGLQHVSEEELAFLSSLYASETWAGLRNQCPAVISGSSLEQVMKDIHRPVERITEKVYLTETLPSPSWLCEVDKRWGESWLFAYDVTAAKEESPDATTG